MNNQKHTIVGTLIGGRYRIEALIGRGGMASVYRARDELLGRAVALKLIAPAAADASAVRRERAEIELLASLNHPALVTLFDAGVAEVDGSERTFLVMELIDGPTLSVRIEQGPIAALDVCRMAADLAEALSIMHAQGVVHRDIKPGNVLLSASGLPDHEFTAKLADFGIAALIDSTRLTAAGGLVGTAAYLSPEQARGGAPAPASDVYSLGLVLLESMTRTRAFPGSLMESVGSRLVSDPPIPASIGSGWSSLLAAMTARTPAARPGGLDVAVATRAFERDLLASGELRPEPDKTVSTVALDPESSTLRLPVRAQAATAILPASFIGRLPPEAIARDADRERTDGGHEARPRRLRRSQIIFAVLGLLAVIAAVLVAAPLVRPAGHEVPVLPTLVEPLYTDLQALMKSVSR